MGDGDRTVFLPCFAKVEPQARAGLKTGDRIAVVGLLRVDVRCYEGFVCTPWSHPIDLHIASMQRLD